MQTIGTYVDNNLMEGEHVIARAELHWAMFIVPGIFAFLGLLMLLTTGESMLLVLSGLWLGWRYIVMRTTELAITNHRILAKFGVIRRLAVDVMNSKVEGVTYNQGIIARIFGFGTVVVRGTGVGIVPVPYIEHPEAFKREVSRVLMA